MGNSAITAIVICLLRPSPPARTVDECLSKLGDATLAVTQGEMEGCVETLRRDCAVGDDVVWKRLRTIVSNDSVRAEVRAEALKVACAKADDQIASEILRMAAAWASEFDFAQRRAQQPNAERAAEAQALLASTVLWQGLQPLQQALADQGPILDLAFQVATQTACSLEAKDRCYHIVADSPAPIEQRRACALRIITAEPRRNRVPDPLLKTLDRSAFPALRELVRQSSDPEKFHYTAAAALAHLGDLEIVSELEALRPAFREAHVNFEGILVGYVWKIDVQNPPSKLLDYIASATERGVELRIWAIKRGVEILPKPEIRTAILAYAQQVPPQERPRLASVKRAAQSLDILEPGDLADIKIPPPPHS